MRQLTGLDTSFLRLETRSTYGHVSGLTVYDPSTTASGELTLEDMKDLLTSRLHMLPPFRWRLAEVPLKLDDPYWIEAPEFDIDFHLREIALAPPGDDHQLAEQVSRIAARPLDRSRPLWELYLIHGLAGGNVGVLTKMHHSAIDGVSGAEIMGILLDTSPQPREVAPPDADWTPERAPSDIEMLGRGVTGMLTRPVKMLRMAPRTLPSLADVPGMGNVPGVDTLSRASARIARLGGGDGQLLERQNLTAPRTSLNGPISPHRRFSFGSVSLADVKAVKDAFGLTVNDVVMSMCTGALRRWLLDHEELPDEPLLAMVPVSVRSEGKKGGFGNQVSVMVVPLPTHEPDLRERLTAMQGAMSFAKERHRAMPATLMQDFAEFIPPAIAARATRVITGITAAGRFSPLFNVVISNVPGPQFPLYSAGARMLGNYPVSAITDGVGLNMTVMSYDGKLDFGLVACREMVPDIWALMDHLRESLGEMMELAAAETAPKKRAKRAAAKSTNGKPKAAPRAKGAKRAAAK